MNVLVTGGAGFIGSHIVGELISAGHRVVIIDNFQSGDRRNVHLLATLYERDLCTHDISEILQREAIEAVCHTAAKTNMRESLEDPVADAQVNIIGLLNTLEACRKAGVKKFVFSSTGGALYGDTTVLPTPEDTQPKPLSPYGITKMAGERYGYFYTNTHNMDFTVLRYSNVYGPRLERKANVGSAVLRIIQALASGERPEIRGDGEQTRDFICVKDIAHANRLAIERARGYSVYNIGSGVETSVNTLTQTIAQVLGVSAQPNYTPAITGEVTRSVLDNTKARTELSWEPKVALEQGIHELVAHLR